jgi:predicted small metal-binding protein
MTKVLKCGDLNAGCNFEIRGHSEDEVLKQVVAHARTAHNMKEFPPDVLSKARSAVHDESEARAQSAGSR